jgi:putative transcriptional regulator
MSKRKSGKDKQSMMLGKTILEVVHEMAQDLHDVKGINAVTMREYDALCLPPVKALSAKDIKKIREKEKVSQPVFARFLNISPSTVKQWEQGAKQPRGGILKLLNLVADKGLAILA